RIGFAYGVKDKTVIRGGSAIYYAGVPADSWDPYPVDGYQTNPFVPNTTNGNLPAFYFGGPNATGTTGCLKEKSLGVTNCQFPTSAIKLPPQLNAGISNGGNPVGVYPKMYTMPRYQNWSISFQRQVSNKMIIELAYVGNHGTRLLDGRSSGGVADNMNPASVLGLGTAVLGAGFTNGTCTVAGSCGTVVAPYAGFTGTVAQALRPWPQYQIINWRFFNYGESHYNAIQAAFEKRMSHGLQAKVAYTY